MKILKKTLSVFLAVLMMASALSVSLVAFAADSETNALYRSLAYSFFSYKTESTGSSTNYVVNTDENGYPIKSLVGDLEQYSVSNESGDYEYEDDDQNPIRAFSYTHTVTAKDDSQNHIREAANAYLGIVDKIMSTEYGTGNYTIPMIIEAASEGLRLFKGDDGKYLFLDGYSYLIDAYGKLVARSTVKTYEVVNGEEKYFDNADSEDIWPEGVSLDNCTVGTLFDYCNVETVIGYFSGNCTTVNSGNWFHDFIFYCYTDLETVLLTESLSAGDLRVRYLTVEWSMSRSFDDSGTKAQYYNNGYTADKDKTSIDTSRRELSNLKGTLDGYFSTYYSEGMLDNMTNQQIIDSYYADIRNGYDTFSSLSNEAKLAVFGDDAYSYMNLITQLTPIVGNTSLDTYLPTHTYEKYYNDDGTNVVYKVTTDKVTTIVSKIDALMTSKDIGDIIKSFIDFSDPKYADKVFYGVQADTAQEVLVQVIQNFLFDDSIINAIMGFLYPMVTNLLDENLTDDFVNGALSGVAGGALNGIIDWILENDDGWLALIYGALTSIGVGLNPAGVAYVWNNYGYTVNNTEFPDMQSNHDILKAAKGGTMDTSTSGWYSTPGYLSIGQEAKYGDTYCGDRWRDVDFDALKWGINGDRTKFQDALCAILAPIAPLLAVILGNQETRLKVGQMIFDVIVYIKDIAAYNDVLLPILEALGIPNLVSGSEFEQKAAAIIPDSGRNKQSVEKFLNEGLLNPLIDWIINVVLKDPIGTILTALPNLSYYFTEGGLLSSIKNLSIPIGLQYAVDYGAVYTLKVGDLLGDALNFLDSLSGIIQLIGINVDTGIPVVGYHADGDSAVHRPDSPGYDESTMTIGVTEAYMDSFGNLNLYQNDLYTTLVKATDENGNPNEYAIYDSVGWSNAAGYVVTAHNDTTATEDEYSTEVYKYYEYTVIDDETGEGVVTRTTFLPADVEASGEYTVVQSVRTLQEAVSLPSLMEYKLQATGTVRSTTSGRYKAFTMTGKDGQATTWPAYQRYYIDMNIDGNDTKGLVLLYIFRYLFSALQYRVYKDGQFTNDYTLIDAFGLGDTLTQELFNGLRIQDIIDNISLHPDESIAALYELFYKNETGSLYEIVNGVVRPGSDHVYDVEYVDFHTDEILSYAEAANDYNYGTGVLYTEYWSREDSEYVVDNLDGIVNNVFKMLKLENSNSLSDMLNGLLSQYVFNNETLSTLATLLYSNIDGLEAVDLPVILKAVLDVDFSKPVLMEALTYAFDGAGRNTEVYSELYKQFNNYGKEEYDATTFYKTSVDAETNETITGESFDWGFNNVEITAKYSDAEIFIRGISAILSPFSFLFKYLFAGDDLSLLDLINIPGYESFYYSWIPLMEALSANDGLVSYEEYFRMSFNGTSDVAENFDSVFYVLSPILRFAEDLIANPVSTLISAIPNIAFFVSIGGLNGVLNNFLHFVYVLLDILQPVYDAYPLLNSLLSNIKIGDLALNLSLPLDLDLNQLVNGLLDSLLGETLSFDIENQNIVLGTKQVEKEVPVPVLDADGNPTYDDEGNQIVNIEMQTVTENVYAVGTLKISLPYIDLTTLCSGTIQEKTSVSGNDYIYLNASGGADLVTLLLRIVTETLFFADNAENVANFLIGYCQLDDEVNNDELLMEIFMYLNQQANANNLADKTMGLVFTIYKVLVPVADNLGGRFENVDFSIIDMFQDLGNIDYYIQQLLNAGETDNPTLSGFARIIALIKQFFERLVQFFKSLFS